MIAVHQAVQLGTPLLADSPYGNIRYTIDTSALVGWIAVAVALVGSICVAMFFAHRATRKWKLNSQAGLFQGLCRAHNLKRRERALLGQVCRVHKLRFPGLVFIEATWLNPAKVPSALQAKRQQMARVHKKLFG